MHILPLQPPAQGKLYIGYPHVARMCFGYIDCLLLSKVSGSAVNTLTAVIIRRELNFPFWLQLIIVNISL